MTFPKKVLGANYPEGKRWVENLLLYSQKIWGFTKKMENLKKILEKYYYSLIPNINI